MVAELMHPDVDWIVNAFVLLMRGLLLWAQVPERAQAVKSIARAAVLGSYSRSLGNLHRTTRRGFGTNSFGFCDRASNVREWLRTIQMRPSNS